MSTTPVHQKADIITRAEGSAMKGVGILLIATHNLAHMLRLTGHDCNEYNFEQESADAIFQFLLHPGPNLLIQLSTLMGYCGIYIFLFMSAFGLVRKYEQGTTPMPKAHTFIWRHYAKLFKLMILGLVAAIAVAYLTPHTKVPYKSDWLAQALMITNWFYAPYTHVFPGPYWFLGLMVELYIIYRLVLYVPRDGAQWRKWLLPVAFAALTLAPQIHYRTAGGEMIYLRYNFFVAGLPFATGLLVARYGGIPRMSRWAWAAVWAGATAIFILMQPSPVLWILSSVVAAIAIIAFVKMLAPCVAKPLVWVGGISSYLFIVHPVIRMFALEWREQVEGHLLIAIYMAVALLTAVAYRRLLAVIPWPKFLR